MTEEAELAAELEEVKRERQVLLQSIAQARRAAMEATVMAFDDI